MNEELARARSNFEDARAEVARLMRPTDGTYDAEPLERFVQMAEALQLAEIRHQLDQLKTAMRQAAG